MHELDEVAGWTLSYSTYDQYEETLIMVFWDENGSGISRTFSIRARDWSIVEI